MPWNLADRLSRVVMVPGKSMMRSGLAFPQGGTDLNCELSCEPNRSIGLCSLETMTPQPRKRMSFSEFPSQSVSSFSRHSKVAESTGPAGGQLDAPLGHWAPISDVIHLASSPSASPLR